MGDVRLLTISTGVLPPGGFAAADWTVTDLASGSGGSGQLAVDLARLPAAGSYPLNRVLYRAGSVNEPWVELVGPAGVAAILADPAGTLPWRAPFPFDVPSGVPVKTWIAAEDDRGTRGPISAPRTQTATEGAGLAPPTAIALSATAVSETTAVGTPVATITADGSPAPDFALTSDPDGRFRIEGASLVLDAPLDHGAATGHAIGIAATNSEGTATAAFTIAVTEETGGTTPATAIYADVIGPAAEVAEIRVYSVPTAPDATVSDFAGLEAALAAAAPGDVILCRAGDYGLGADRRLTGPGLGGAPVRVVAEGYLSVRFDRLVIDGADLSVEGVRATGREIMVSSARNVTLRHCHGRRMLIGSSRDCAVEDCVFDHDFAGGSQIKRWPGSSTYPNALRFRRTIFCRGGATVDLFQCTECHDLDFEQCLFFDLRVPSTSGLHSDIFQCFNPHVASGTQRWRFHRCLFFTYDLSDIRSNQGLFLSDGSYRGVDVSECLVGPPNGASRQFVIQNPHGTIRNVTVLGDTISGENKSPASNANATLTDCVAQGFQQNGGGPASAASSGNLWYGGALGEWFDTSPPGGLALGSDWRHYRDTRGLDIGAAPFLDYLEGKWG